MATTCRVLAGLPNGQVPVLAIDGYVLPQTLAIVRYVGKLGGEKLGYTSSRTVALEYTGGRSSSSSSVEPGSMQTCNQVFTPSTRCQFGGVLYPVDNRILE